MTEDSPQPPESENVPTPESNSEPQAEPTPASADSSLQSAWIKIRSVLKTQAVRLLRGTIQLLEKTVESLEQEPSTPTESGWVIALLGQVQRLWSQILQWVRSRLPEAANQKLSDLSLSGILVGSLVVLLWVVPGLLSGPSKPPEIARVPLSQRQPPADLTAPSDLSAPSGSEEVKPVPIVPSPSPSPIPSPTPIASPTPSPTPAPPPPAPLTPEERLIAAVQDQVIEASTDFGEELVLLVRPNFRKSFLMVRLSSAWYGLETTQQDELAQKLFQQAKDLNFSKLEIVDSKGALLARSPVVGSEMVILKRSNQPTEVAAQFNSSARRSVLLG